VNRLTFFNNFFLITFFYKKTVFNTTICWRFLKNVRYYSRENNWGYFRVAYRQYISGLWNEVYIIDRDLRKRQSRFRVHYRIFLPIFAFFAFFVIFAIFSIILLKFGKTRFFPPFLEDNIKFCQMTQIDVFYAVSSCVNTLLLILFHTVLSCAAPRCLKIMCLCHPKCLYTGFIYAEFFAQICRIFLR